MHYEFVVRARMSDRAAAAFPELTAEYSAARGTTSLFGTIADQTQLRGLLARFDSMALEIIELRQLPGLPDSS
ncbi:hypothetical protein G4X40_04850 [Rhodococcus sp. D2-41]|uniref:Uncharacterized protein n=1 Tax=Speluncibacter jeojiensis TaxID=2710754 RepID=A0A9X4REZ4_9ACTN|nr:hypothetical protein [Rhodococcus sp. D2-41]MDG3009471.1 hypothetical protein [Rhodococcus sp. D2-41]MDG3016400.1 hypothetical protein [Corynebacteriales bacterium D3-21]